MPFNRVCGIKKFQSTIGKKNSPPILIFYTYSTYELQKLFFITFGHVHVFRRYKIKAHELYKKYRASSIILWCNSNSFGSNAYMHINYISTLKNSTPFRYFNERYHSENYGLNAMTRSLSIWTSFIQ